MEAGDGQLGGVADIVQYTGCGDQLTFSRRDSSRICDGGSTGTDRLYVSPPVSQLAVQMILMNRAGTQAVASSLFIKIGS
jgi:hypothetical protein